MKFKTKTQIMQEEIEFLRAQVAQLQNYVLMVAPGAFVPGNGLTVAESGISEPTHRLYSTETEEDIEYQLQEGLIDEDFAKKLLEEAGADNTEIELT